MIALYARAHRAQRTVVRHPHLDFPLPAKFVALLDWLLEGVGSTRPWEHAERKTRHVVYTFDGDLLDARAGRSLAGPPSQGELGYDDWPLEMIPFSTNGGAGLRYGWALLAPELELAELPCVSFAPCDESAVWLGDTMREALEIMLVGTVRDAEKWPAMTSAPQAQPGWQTLCAALALAPDVTRSDVSAGARVSGRKIAPAVPAGWRFVLTDDGVGVLAKHDAFGADVDRRALFSEDATLSLARRHLDAGHPASALVALKQGSYEESPRPVVELAREAYAALGRPALVRRADAWLAYPR